MSLFFPTPNTSSARGGLRNIQRGKCVWTVCLLSLLGNNSVKVFQRQQIIAGGVVFYAVSVVSKNVGNYFFPELLVLITLKSQMFKMTTTSTNVLLARALNIAA
jgi:hypothetical protein